MWPAFSHFSYQSSIQRQKRGKILTQGRFVSSYCLFLPNKSSFCDPTILALVHWSKSRQSFAVAKVFYLLVETGSIFPSIKITADSQELLYAS